MPEPLQWILYNDFSGGENVDVDLDNLADNEVMKGENVDFNVNGGFETRLGCIKFNSISYGAQVEQIFEWKKSDGSIQLMAVIGTNMCKIAEDGTSTVIQALNATAKKCFHFEFQNKLYFGDGFKYFVYDGTTCAEVAAAVGADLTAIKRCKYVTWHDKSFRWLFTGDPQNRVVTYYSEPNEPNNVKALSLLYPTQGMGEILGLKMFGDAVIAFFRYGARKWSGTDPARDVQWLEIPVPEGALSNDAMTLTPGSLTYLGKGGWWMLPPSILNYNVTMQTDQSMVPNIAFGKQIKTITAITRPDIACSVYDPATGYLMLAYTKTVGENRNSRVLVNLWGTRTFWHYTGWQVNDWCLRANGDLLYAGDGFIYKIRSGSNDAGVAINQLVECKKVNLGYPNNYKVVGKFLVKAGARVEKSTADIKIKSAGSSVSKANVELKTNRKWTDPWNSPWASSDSQLTEINFDPALTGQDFQAIYTNNRLDESMLIYGHSYGYKVKQPIGKKI